MNPQLHHCLRYDDVEVALDFLHALGFTDRLIVRDENDPSVVVHGELRWRDNGGLMIGSTRDDGKGEHLDTSHSVANLVVTSDEEVDATLARAVAAGGRVAMEPANPPYGGRCAGVLDPEGNFWNVDSYPGA